MDDEDDAFLYGGSNASATVPPLSTSNAISADDVLDFELDEPTYETPPRTHEELHEAVAAPTGLGLPEEQTPVLQQENVQPGENDQQEENEDDDEEDEEESDDDIEIITEAPTRSVDFRAVRGPGGPPGQPSRPSAPPTQNRPVHLTTEYNLKPRPTEAAPAPAFASAQPSSLPSSSAQQPPPERQQSQDVSQQHTPQPQQIQPLPELLPDPIRAPPSHPSLDLSAPGLLVVPGTLQARPVWEVDLDSLSSKSWRRPGANLSDWFNYGFDEISWETYCIRRKELGETASGLKANVLNVAGLPEDQLLNLPPDMRSVVLGTAAMLPLPGQGGPNMMMPGAGGPGLNNKRMVSGPGPQGMPGMGIGGSQAMGPGPGMGGQQTMGPGPGMGGSGPGMAMGGKMGPGMGMGGPGGMGMSGMGGPGPGGGMGGPMGMMGGPGPNMLGMNMMNMPPEMMMQMQGMGMMNGHGQEEYDDDGTVITEKPLEKEQIRDDKSQENGTPGKVESPLDAPQEQNPVLTPNDPPARGGFRGRAAAARARGFAARGRGRGGFHVDGTARPASPLPPNVPTGPRNPNTRSYKDKDRDGDSKVEGLDYGGDRERTQSEDGRSRHRERDRDRDHRERDRDRDRERDHRDRDRDRDRDRERDRGERETKERDRDRDRGKSEEGRSSREKTGTGRKRAHSKESDDGSGRSKRR